MVGYVLTHPDDKVFAEKLVRYDEIEGYEADYPADGLYQRDAVEAIILDDNDKETKEKIWTWIYHRSGISEKEEIPDGDWLKRDRHSGFNF